MCFCIASPQHLLPTARLVPYISGRKGCPYASIHTGMCKAQCAAAGYSQETAAGPLRRPCRMALGMPVAGVCGPGRGVAWRAAAWTGMSSAWRRSRACLGRRSGADGSISVGCTQGKYKIGQGRTWSDMGAVMQARSSIALPSSFRATSNSPPPSTTKRVACNGRILRVVLAAA